MICMSDKIMPLLILILESVYFDLGSPRISKFQIESPPEAAALGKNSSKISMW